MSNLKELVSVPSDTLALRGTTGGVLIVEEPAYVLEGLNITTVDKDGTIHKTVGVFSCEIKPNK
jgi:hypothetical protein